MREILEGNSGPGWWGHAQQWHSDVPEARIRRPHLSLSFVGGAWGYTNRKQGDPRTFCKGFGDLKTDFMRAFLIFSEKTFLFCNSAWGN